MPELTDNPARLMRLAAEAMRPQGVMLHWDADGTALLVSDAPRRGHAQAMRQTLLAQDYVVTEQDDLLYIDLPLAAYEGLRGQAFLRPGVWNDAWFAEQALLTGILHRLVTGEAEAPDIPLLRAAMIACCREETHVRTFLSTLRVADADALRRRSTASACACAALAAHWLWTQRGVGLPPIARWSQ